MAIERGVRRAKSLNRMSGGRSPPEANDILCDEIMKRKLNFTNQISTF
jgi:hypothetical protein